MDGSCPQLTPWHRKQGEGQCSPTYWWSCRQWWLDSRPAVTVWCGGYYNSGHLVSVSPLINVNVVPPIQLHFEVELMIWLSTDRVCEAQESFGSILFSSVTQRTSPLRVQWGPSKWTSPVKWESNGAFPFLCRCIAGTLSPCSQQSYVRPSQTPLKAKGKVESKRTKCGNFHIWSRPPLRDDVE